MNQTLVKQKRFVETLSMIAVGLIGMIFIVLAIAAVLQTSRIDPTQPYSEIILYDNDAVAVNIALIVLSLICFIALKRSRIRLSAVNTRFVVFVMLIVTTILPLVWINLVQSVATGEARTLLDTAKGAAGGNYAALTKEYYSSFSYYEYYPGLLGYVFFAELLYRVFGSGASDIVFQIPNVIALDFIYVGLVMITARIFKRRSLTNMTAIALTICVQPMLMTTFTSGMIPGLAFAVWAVFFTVRYMQDNKLWLAGIAALLITLAVLMKSNYYIVLIALIIALILHTVGTKRFIALLAALVMGVCAFGVQRLVIFSYAQRGNIKIDTGVTPIITAYEGISESSMAPGWFNWNAMTTLRDSARYTPDQRMSSSVGEKNALDKIGQRIDELNKNHALTDFYKKKLLSQFNEPFFESVWISQTREHRLAEGEQLPGIVKSVYTGGLSVLLGRWLPYYTMMIYAGFAAGMVWMIIRRRLSPDAVILPITVLGAVLYYMIGEAKSQYILPYFILLIPFAMYGLLETTDILRKKTDLLFKKQAEPDAESSESFN